MYRRLAGAVLAVGVLTCVPSAGAAVHHATPSTFASTFSAAAGGDTIYLASGSYGTFTGGSKSSRVVIKREPGAAPAMKFDFGNGDQNFTVDGVFGAGGSFAGTMKNITVRNSQFTSALSITGLANANVLLERNKHQNINAPSGAPPARIHLAYRGSQPSGVTVRDSLLVGGDADGIQAGTALTIIGNHFHDIIQAGPNHTDAIQLYGATDTVIRGNWLHNNTDGIVAYDGTARNLIENNVVETRTRPWAIELYSDDGSTIRHNTLIYKAPCEYNLPCGIIDLNRKSADDAGRGTIVKDNIATEVSLGNGSAIASRGYNMLRRNAGTGDTIGTPAFAGGTAPTTYSGYQLSVSSPGRNAASDGKDQGALIAAAPGPTPTPSPAPDKPAVATWTAPSNAQTGTAVVLDGTASQGDGPLACTWSFENADASIVWETLTGCKLSKTFRTADVKYVKLTVRDADGDTDSMRNSFAVTNP